MQRGGALGHALLQRGGVLLHRGQQAGVFYGDRGLGGKQPHQVQRLGGKRRGAVVVDDRGRADDARPDGQRHAQHTARGGLGVHGRSFRPRRIVVHRKRLAGLHHPPRHAFARLQDAAHRVRRRKAAGFAQSLAVGVQQVQAAAGRTGQFHLLLHDALQQRGQVGLGVDGQRDLVQRGQFARPPVQRGLGLLARGDVPKGNLHAVHLARAVIDGRLDALHDDGAAVDQRAFLDQFRHLLAGHYSPIVLLVFFGQFGRMQIKIGLAQQIGQGNVGLLQKPLIGKGEAPGPIFAADV